MPTTALDLTHVDWSQFPLASQAEDFFRNTYLPRYNRLLAEVEKTPLAFLIWGPGPGAGDLYMKRCQIRGELRQIGVTALFSEEIDEAHPALDYSSKSRELVQAEIADFIVVLQTSPGSIAEVHDFSTFLGRIGHKMMIFIDDRYVSGYSYSGALSELKGLYKNVETYHYPEDIRDCHLTRAVKERVRILRHAKWRATLI